MNGEAGSSLLDCLPAAAVLVDAAGRVVRANDAARRLLPLDGPETEAGDWPRAWGLFAEDGRTPLDAKGFALALALKGQSVEGPVIRVVNSRVPQGASVIPSAGPVLDAGGRPVGAVLILVDVTDLHREIQALRTNRMFLESIVETVPAMIFVKEASELRFERFNRAGEELLGIPRQELIGRNDYDFFPPDQADHFQQLDRATLDGQEPVDIPEEPIRTAKGERWLHTKKIPIRDADGKPLYLLGISLDITDRKKAEDALKEAHAQLEVRVRERTEELVRANAELQREIQERMKAEAALRQSQKMEAIGRLAGGVAHDFNNMLTAILAYAHLLLDKAHAEGENGNELRQIVLAGERAAGLTRQLLAFSRRQVLVPEVLDLGQVVHGTEDMLRRLLGEDVDLRVSIAPDLGLVMADPGQMEQVLMNLSVNARDAMPSGGRLTIDCANAQLPDPTMAPAPSLPPGSYVFLAVRDTGSGIDPDIMPHIFEPFYTTKARGEGTGLGLPTVFGIVQQSGGDIVVTSEPQAGTTFRIFLPRCGASEVPKKPPSHESLPRVDGKRGTVLLVEDENLVRRTLRAMLEALGYDVLAAVNADDAVREFAQHGESIDLLMTDVVMPGPTGRELAANLRALRPDLPVLFISGYTDAPPPDAPGNGFLQKPFTPRVLEARIRDLLGR